MSIVHTHTETMSEEDYREFALGDPSGGWELVRGRLWERPGMSVTHNRVTMDLVELLLRQLDRNHYRVSTGLARLRVSEDTYYVPDVAVIPTAMARRLGENPRTLEAYAEPLPLVVEVWSPSTGKRDIDLKLPDYQARGDAEIWFIHPFERTLTAWSRTPDGTYVETVYRDGIARPASLPHIAIDLEELFVA
ncbi:MAG: Uma2 family endonuclease [Thermomicrobiales bacterium]